MSAPTVFVVTEFDGMDCPERVVGVYGSEADARSSWSPRRASDFTVHEVPFYADFAAEASR